MKKIHKKTGLINHLESLELPQNDYDNIQGINDLEMIDNVTRKRKAKIAKKIAAGKFKGKKLKRKSGIMAGTRMTTFGKIAGVATGGASLLASKAGRKVAKKIGKGIVGMTVLLPLQPLRPVMIKALKKEGVSVSNKTPLTDIANLFYKNVVRKKNPSFDEIDLNTIQSYDDNVIGAAIGAIVSGIISFFKNLKKKKESGEPLTAGEELMEGGLALIEGQIAAKQGEPIDTENEPLTNGNPIDVIAVKTGVGVQTIYIVIALLIVVIVYFGFIRNRK